MTHSPSVRIDQFNEFSNLDFSELIKLEFREGHEYRNATDYYFHPKTKLYYSYYWGESPGSWLIRSHITKEDFIIQPQKGSKCALF